ncbi:MAG: zinc dependent phospholipase C family protein [Candidatus Methanosuratincola petrocarbonis]
MNRRTKAGIHIVEAALLFCLIFLLSCSSLATGVFAWSNGGFSQDPGNPDYGTHDWIAEHALEWLPEEEKQFLSGYIASYLYGTELPDNGQASDGIGDTSLHHIYFSSSGALVDDSAAVRANATYHQALSCLRSGDFETAAKWAGVMSHYIADMAVFGHVLGAGTDWGAEVHHSDYESYVNVRTASYSAEFNSYLSFDGRLDSISAYDAAVQLAYDTTFDPTGGLTCTWMDQNYNWSDPSFMGRAGESLNLAVNYVADALHMLYVEWTSSYRIATVTFSVSGLGSDSCGAILAVDGVEYAYADLPKSFTWVVGSNHSVSWSDSVNSGMFGKRYVLVSVSGLSTSQSGEVKVPEGGGLVSASYKAQHFLALKTDPVDGGSVSPGSGWYDAGTTVQISAFPSIGYEFSGWVGSGIGSYSGNSSAVAVTMGEPINETAIFVRLDVTPNVREPSWISCAVSKPSSALEEGVAVTGFISPMHPGAAIKLVFAKPDGSNMTASTVADGHGRYEFAFAPDLPGNWGVTASWEGDVDHEGAESQTVLFSVEEVQPQDRQWLHWIVIAIVAIAILIIAVAVVLLLVKRRRTEEQP